MSFGFRGWVCLFESCGKPEVCQDLLINGKRFPQPYGCPKCDPIFRMLGSDPVYQYDSGDMVSKQSGVELLEPVYPRSGASRKWVEWFLKSMSEESWPG